MPIRPETGQKQIHQGEMTMKTLRLTLLLRMLFTTFNLLAESTPQKSFDVMKSLAGTWEARPPWAIRLASPTA